MIGDVVARNIDHTFLVARTTTKLRGLHDIYNLVFSALVLDVFVTRVRAPRVGERPNHAKDPCGVKIRNDVDRRLDTGCGCHDSAVRLLPFWETIVCYGIQAQLLERIT
jgi:hypothetical protein